MKTIKQKERTPNKAFNFDSWAFAATLLLAVPCFSGIHLTSWRD
jgi:hypothetical protein